MFSSLDTRQQLLDAGRLEHGNGDIQHAVVHELMKDIASLFSHKYGHGVRSEERRVGKECRL